MLVAGAGGAGQGEWIPCHLWSPYRISALKVQR